MDEREQEILHLSEHRGEPWHAAQRSRPPDTRTDEQLGRAFLERMRKIREGDWAMTYNLLYDVFDRSADLTGELRIEELAALGRVLRELA